MNKDFHFNSEYCPFISNHQCLRIHSFAVALRSVGNYVNSYFGLVYHPGNDIIKDEWNNYFDNVIGEKKNDLFSIEAGEIVKNAVNENYRRYMIERYDL